MKRINYLVVLYLAFFLFCEKKQKELQVGKILFYEGEVSINDVVIKDISQPIQYGDIIKTGEKSKIRFVIKEGLIVQLNQNSEFYVKYEDKKFNLNLKKGWMAAVKNQDENQMDIHLPTAVASVRGTSICFKVESELSNYACTCNGKLHWHTKDGQVLEVSADHHSAKRFKIVNGNVKIEEAGLEYHDDKIIEELAKTIHHNLDWK